MAVPIPKPSPRWRPALRSASTVVGVAEVLVALAALGRSCSAALGDSSLNGFFTTYLFGVAVLVFLLPGALLFSRSRWRWLGQLVPLGFLAWVAIDAASAHPHAWW